MANLNAASPNYDGKQRKNEWSPLQENREENGWMPPKVHTQVKEMRKPENRRKSKKPIFWIAGVIWLLSVIGELESVLGDLIGLVIMVLLVPGLIIWLALRRKKTSAMKAPEPVMEEAASMEGMPLEPAPLVTPEPAKVEPAPSVFKNLMHVVEEVIDEGDLSASFQSLMSENHELSSMDKRQDLSVDDHECYESHSHYQPFAQEDAVEEAQDAPARTPEPEKPAPMPVKRGITRAELRRSLVMSEVLGKPVARRER